MIKSMTGFGRSEVVSGARKIVVEIKAVNHCKKKNNITILNTKGNNIFVFCKC